MPNQKNYSDDFIINCAIEFSEMSLETDIYKFIGEKLHELTHKIVIVNSFLPETYHLKTEHIFGYKPLAFKIARGIGYNPLGKEYTLPPEVAQLIYSNEIIKVPGGLDELTFDKLSGRNARILEKVVRLNEIYVTGFTKGKEIYGSAIIIVRKNEHLENQETLKLFSRLASIALQKRNSELSNKEINRRQHTLIENIHDMVCFKDQHGENIMINKAFAEFVGLKKEQILGKKDEDIFLEPIAEKRHKSDKKAEISKEKQREEEIIVNKTGEKRHLDTIKAPILGDNGKYEGLVSVSRDITELIAREHQIKKSEQRFFELSNFIPYAIFETNTDHEITFSNKKGLHLLKIHSLEGLPDKKWINYLSCDNKEDIIQKIKSVYELHIDVEFECELAIKTGKALPAYMYISPVIDKEKVSGYRVLINDLTEKKMYENALKASEEKYRTFTDNSSELMFMADEEGYITYANLSMADTLKYAQNDLIGKSIFEFLAPKRKKRINEKAFIKELKKQKKFSYETSWVDKEENEIPGHITILASNDSSGYFVGFKGIFRNVYEIKKSEEEISKLNLAVEQSPSSILITDTRGIIEYVNPKFTEVTGYTKEEVIGKRPNILKSGRHDKEFYKNLWNTITNEKEWRGEMENKKKSGEIFWELASITGIKNNEGTITQYIGIKEDITERKKAEQEIIAAKEKAENADKLKTAFLSNMSHEIRTPMNAIIGFSDLLKMGSLDQDKQNEFIDYIKSNGQILLQLIDDIIDVAKIESDNIRIEKINFDVNEMLSELYQSFKNNSSIVASEDIDFRLNIPAKENMIIHNDPIRFKQIFANLINNAFKFTKSGYIEFGYKINEDDSLLFYVEDTGIGMSEQYQKQIFERFSQVDESNTREFGGAGLGLTISKNLAHLMGGDIWVKSEKGKGSVFMFTISSELEKVTPSRPKEAIEKETGEKSWKGKKIMIVEDNEANYLYLKEILLDYECQIIWAKDAEETILRYKDTPDINLILMDIRLPGGKNGYDLTRQIKADNPHIPVVAQTAYAMSDEKDNSIKAGCDDYLSKPIDINQLNKTLKKYLD